MKRIFFYLLLISATLRAADQLYPSVAFDGENFLVVWQEMRADSQNEILGKRVDLSGNFIDQEPILISPPEDNALKPAVSFGSENYLVIWKDSTDAMINGAMVSKSGAVVNNDIAIFKIDPILTLQNSSVTSDGINFMTAIFLTPYIWYNRISQSGIVIDTGKVYCCGESRDPQVFFGDTCYLVVWKDAG